MFPFYKPKWSTRTYFQNDWGLAYRTAVNSPNHKKSNNKFYAEPVTYAESLNSIKLEVRTIKVKYIWKISTFYSVMNEVMIG